MKYFKVVFAIIATLIGAGFASGQEICNFFYVYGIKGLAGLVVCSTLFSLIIYRVFEIINSRSIENYKELVLFLVGKHGFIMNIIVNLFLLITFFIMIAGFGAFFAQEVGISTYIGSGILACLCFFTFISNTDGVLKVNSMLVPILILFIVLIGFINITNLDKDCLIYLSNTNNLKLFDWLLSSILYTSYNSILLIPMLVTLKQYINNKTSTLAVAIFSGLILLLLAILIFFMLTKSDINVNKLQMPVIYVIRKFYRSFIHIYAFIILSSIYTTAISIGISFLKNISNTLRSNYPLIVLIMCITGLGISGFGFSNLVIKLYPFFGYLGLIQIAFLITSIKKVNKKDSS